MKSPGIVPAAAACLAVCASALILGCAHAPPPDRSADFRSRLAAEIGPLEFGVPGTAGTEEPGEKGAPGNAAGGPPGPGAKRYAEFYGFPDFTRRAGVFHRMGVLEDRAPSLGVQYFVPRGRRKGTVFLAHGYLDHTGPLRPIIEAAAEAGFSVAAYDLPGHGFSGGPRGDIGCFAEYGLAAGRVVEAFRRGTEDGRPGDGDGPAFPRPWIAVGHSTGAASFFILLQSLAGKGISSPFERVVFINPLVRSARWGLSVAGLRLVGWAVRSLKPLGEPDPLLGIDVFPVSWAERLRDWNAEAADYPTIPQRGLIIQGRRDKVVDFRYNVPFLTGRMPGLEIAYVKEAGHVPYTDTEGNREVLRLLVDYLEKEGGETARR